MTAQDLERLAFLLRSRLALPDTLAVPLELAIVNWLQDPSGRSFDFWLALPPRAPRTDIHFAQQRDRLYQQLAATRHGSTLSRSQGIVEDLEIWLAGHAAAASFGAAFEIFLRAYGDLEPPHLKLTALRAVISPEICQ